MKLLGILKRVIGFEHGRLDRPQTCPCCGQVWIEGRGELEYQPLEPTQADLDAKRIMREINEDIITRMGVLKMGRSKP